MSVMPGNLGTFFHSFFFLRSQCRDGLSTLDVTGRDVPSEWVLTSIVTATLPSPRLVFSRSLPFFLHSPSPHFPLDWNVFPFVIRNPSRVSPPPLFFFSVPVAPSGTKQAWLLRSGTAARAQRGINRREDPPAGTFQVVSGGPWTGSGLLSSEDGFSPERTGRSAAQRSRGWLAAVCQPLCIRHNAGQEKKDGIHRDKLERVKQCLGGGQQMACLSHPSLT